MANLRIGSWWWLGIAIVMVGGIAAYFIFKRELKSEQDLAAAQQPAQPLQVIQDTGPAYEVAYHPSPYSPGSDLKLWETPGTYGLTGSQTYSPNNMYVTQGGKAYYYASNRVPDFLLGAEQQASLYETRVGQILYPPPPDSLLVDQPVYLHP